MTSEPAVAVIGEALVDIGADGTPRPGGSPLNVAVGLARLGQPTALLARFGSDAYARLLRAHAAAAGVLLDWCVEATEPSATARVHLDADGVARYDFAVDGAADFGWSEPELTVPSSARLVHFGSLASWLPPGDAVVAERVAALHAGGRVLISYDPNVRPPLQPDPVRARAQVQEAVRHAHVVKVSTDDLRHLYGDERPEEVAARWLAAGPGLVVVTAGASGVLGITRTGRVDRPARPVTVVDTVGAGDAFMSGLLDALVRRDLTSPAGLSALSPDQLGQILDDAALVAALTCARPGADPPTREEMMSATER